MKNPFPHFIATVSILIFLSLTTQLFSQGPPAPPSNGHAQTTNQQPGNTGGSAPIGSGLGILIAMGVVWAGYKIRKNKV